MDALVAAYGFDQVDDPDFDESAHAFAVEQGDGEFVAFPAGAVAAYTTAGASNVYPLAGAFGVYPPSRAYAGPAAALSVADLAAAALSAADPAADDLKNPWKLVKSRKIGRTRRTTPEISPPTPAGRGFTRFSVLEDLIDDDFFAAAKAIPKAKPNRGPKVKSEIKLDSSVKRLVLSPENVIEIEVPCATRTGSLRKVRKLAQSQKSGYVSTCDGPGIYVWGSYGPSSLEF